MGAVKPLRDGDEQPAIPRPEDLREGQARIVVHYDDGRRAVFNPNRPRLLLNMEAKWGVQQPDKHEQIAWLAHHAVAPGEPYEDWVDTVDEFESIEGTGPKADPS
jgi:hypothetical protein